MIPKAQKIKRIVDKIFKKHMHLSVYRYKSENISYIAGGKFKELIFRLKNVTIIRKDKPFKLKISE